MADLDAEFVISELEKHSSRIRILKSDVLIVCPFHADSNPSCSVHTSGHKMPVGTFHCWSCGAKGPWHKLADRLGLDSGSHYHPENFALSRAHAIRRRYDAEQEQRRNQFNGRLPAGCQPWEHGNFRELSEEFLIRIGAKRFYDDRSDCYRIVFPVKNQRGVIKGSTSRRLDAGKDFPWINSPGVWTSSTFYPLELMPSYMDTVVLVEGPYDALRLNYHGIPALSILGTQNWNYTKVSILEGLGINTVVLCMDGDPAGRIAEAKIFNDMEGKLKRKRFRLPIENPPIDPGNMDEEKIEALREFAGF